MRTAVLRRLAARAGLGPALWFCVGLGLALPCAAGVVTLRADPWYPYNGEPDSARPGYMIEIARYAFARGGHRLDYQLLPWQRSMDEVMRGRIDCVVGVQRANGRPLLFPEESLGRVDEAFFGLRDMPPWDYRGPADLRGKVLAVIGGYRYGDVLDNYIAGLADTRSVYVGSGEAALARNIKMLLAGRVDLVLEAPYVFVAKAREMGVMDRVKEVDRVGDPKELYIACSPVKDTSKEYLRLLDAGIRELRRTGELRRILDQYGVEDWQQP